MLPRNLSDIGDWLPGFWIPIEGTDDESSKPEMPDPAPQPYLNADGEHVFVVGSIHDRTGAAVPGAAGEIRWSARDGLTFRFEIPHESTTDAAPSPYGMIDRPPPGLSEVSETPSWSGTIKGGGDFSLFGAVAQIDTKHRPFEPEYRSRSTVRGRATLGSVTIPLDCPLGFRHDTPNRPREFLPSFSMLRWPGFEKFEFTDEHHWHSRLRGKLVLQSEPALTVYGGTTDPGTRHGAWLIDEGPLPESGWIPSDAAEDARSFLSFLVGRNLPFHWRDTFPDEATIQRLYIGTRRATADVAGIEQPLPLNNIGEAVQHAPIIGAQLPALFARFRSVRRDYNLEFVLSPIWAAFDGYADDKLALACVSLERLATAHGDYLEKLYGKRPKAKFLTKEQSKPLLKALADTATEVAGATGISDDNLRILKNKIENVHQPPNADKLGLAFADVGVELREEEEDALNNRNRALHGRATMKGDDLGSIEADLNRFDILRTLIHKAVLALLAYEGQYLDYGDRAAGRAYSIRPFVRKPPPPPAPDDDLVQADDVAAQSNS
jgi:hypothetical protein